MTLKLTDVQYDESVALCKSVFLKKAKDYGTSWRVLRPASVTDQIFIKAQRIRTILEKKSQRVEDDIGSEYIGIVNYSIIALIQTGLEPYDPSSLPERHTGEAGITLREAERLFDEKASRARKLMEAKNHDYGEAWRDMRPGSFPDMILMRLLRIRQIEDNDGKTLVSEGIDANYYDIINYAIFALIKLREGS